MTQELSVNLYCVCMRNGVKIWVEKSKAEELQSVLQRIDGNKFILFENQTMNSADIVGVFSAETMEDLVHEKNGEWKCDKGNWHKKFTDCECGYYRDGKRFIHGQGWV